MTAPRSFTITDARLTGTADFAIPATDLDGPLTIYVRSTVENGSHLGIVQGSFKVRDDDTNLKGSFVGTLDAAGKFSGFLTGTARGNHANVLGTLSGTFAQLHLRCGPTGPVNEEPRSGRSRFTLARAARRKRRARRRRE